MFLRLWQPVSLCLSRLVSRRISSRLLGVMLAGSLAVTVLLGNAPTAQAQQVPGAQAEMPGIPAGQVYGGLQLDSYCRSLGYVTVVSTGDYYYGWRCVDASGGQSGFSMKAACQWQYNDSAAQDYTPNFYHATGGVCFHGTFRGGLNLRAYCTLGLHANDVQLRGNTVDDWYCVTYSASLGGYVYSVITLLNACKWQYSGSYIVFRFDNFYAPTTGECWQIF
jgi:hypothetical protein